MASFAFAAPSLLSPSLRPSSSRRVRPLRPDRLALVRVAPQWRASSGPGHDDAQSSSPEDDRLHSELRAKVDELFGGPQNVTIDLDAESDSQFKVRRDFMSSSASVITQGFRSPWSIFTSIAIVSLISGAFFTALYYSGAVHGYNPSKEQRYEMPTYGSKSYIDPQDLLNEDLPSMTGFSTQSTTH